MQNENIFFLQNIGIKVLRKVSVFLLILILFFSPVFDIASFADNSSNITEPLLSEAKANPKVTAKDYTYSVTITFGYMSFMYDWGTWNSDTLSYDAGQASSYPAQSTVNGKPGWYNFDGINNKISVTCQHTLGGDVEFPFTVNYDDIIESDGGTSTINSVVKNINMECYEVTTSQTPDWNMTVKGLSGADSTLKLNKLPFDAINGTNFYKTSVQTSGAAPATKDVYISFYGVPLKNDDSQFHSETITQIGYLTLKIGTPVIKTNP